MKEKPPEASSSDEKLVERARSGDLRAMDALVSRHHAAVFRVALGILRNEDDASDVAQEAFLKGFRGLGGFRGDAAFKTWILTIAANEARMVLRKVGRRKEVALEAVAPVPTQDLSAHERVERSEDAGRIREVLAGLPDKQRQSVELRIYEGLSFREIGAIIGSSEGAARVNYHHGIRRLREMMK